MRILLLTILTFLSLFCRSQILKIDKGEIDSDSANYLLGNINLDFNINNRSTTADEQVTFIGLNGQADLVYVGKENAFILLNNVNYFKSTGGPLISTGYTHFRINFLRKRTLSYETFTQIQYDDGRRMPLRRLAGGGIRWKVTESEKSELHLGTGAMYEYEEWRPIESESTITKEIWKNSSYIGFQTSLNKTIKFNGIAYYQGGYDHESDLFRSRFSGDFSLSFSITGNLAFTASFTSQYEDRPIIRINNWVYSYTNGLKWNF